MKKLCAVMALLICAAGLSGCGGGDVPQLAPSVTASEDTAAVKRGDVADVSQYEAYVCAQLEEICAQGAGTVAESYVLLGKSVKKGELLAVMDASMAKSQLEQLTAELESAEAEAEFNIATMELDLEILALKGGGTQTQLEIEILSAQLETERGRLELLRENYGARIDRAQAELDAASLYAPCDGEVVFAASEGDGIPAGSPVVTLADGSRLTVQYSGSSVLSTEDFRVEAQIAGGVYSLTQQPRNTSDYIAMALSGQTPPSIFAFNDAQLPEDVRAGTFASLLVYSREAPDTLYVPVNALYNDSEGCYVYVSENGEKTRRAVTLGLKTDVYAELLSGVEEGEIVYVKQ